MDLTYFNPNSQKESDFLMGFVARQRTLDFFLNQLRLVPASGAARHYLIIAPRGFGKTSLLRRIAIGVRTDEQLNTNFIPLRFREEQHNVISLDVFWRNCLQSLAEAREDEGASPDEIAALDAAWDVHAPRQALTQDEQDGEPAWQLLHAHCERLQRRPLLLIDNLDTLLAGLSSHHQWGLRKRLQSDDGPVLIAAASRYPAATHDQAAAFYEFFRIQPLDKLNDQEVFSCLRNLAVHRGPAGRPVLTLLDKDPGRVAALNTMAGGNPRTLSVLYGVLESHKSADVLSQLNAMLDTFTGWYQARTEELPIQARAVFDALALNWDPMTAAALGLATGLDTPIISSQLTRLEKAGYVEPVALSKRGKGRSGYQVSERFFNIWYLMRNGPRRARQSILFLTKFLQSCFSPAERRSHAISILESGQQDPTIAAHDDVLARQGAATDPALHERVAKALEQRAFLLREGGRLEASESAYHDAIRWDSSVSRFHLGLGNLLLDFTGEINSALATFQRGLETVTNQRDRVLLHAYMAHAIALHGGDRLAARTHANCALEDDPGLSPAGRRLLEALPIWSERSEPDWSSVFEHIGQALTSDDPTLWTNYSDDLQRILWFVLANGQGDNFKHWMADAQFQNRYAPLYHAFVAALEGEDHLLRINPETRQPAQAIYAGIVRRLKLWPTQKGSKKTSVRKQEPDLAGQP